ncbi:MAG: hypothetical protein SNJ71_06995, partial [Bacteroidales bacterium]
MKKAILLLMSTVIFFAVGCKKDEVEKSDKKSDVVTTSGGAGTNMNSTSEKSKQMIEESGMKMINAMSSMQKSQTVSAVSSLMKLSSKSSFLNSDNNAVKLLRTINNSRNDNGSTMLKSFKSGWGEDIDLESNFKEIQGIYTWNSKKEDWDKEEKSGELIVKFPTEENSSNNNAEFKIYDLKFSSYTGNNYYYATSIIRNMKAYLKVDNVEYMNYSFNANYNSNGIPTLVSCLLNFEKFELSYNMSYSPSSATSDYVFKYEGQILMAQGFSIQGTLTEQKAQEIENYYNNAGEDAKPSKIGEFITTALIYYQLVDIKITGSVDAKNITKKLDDYLGKED